MSHALSFAWRLMLFALLSLSPVPYRAMGQSAGGTGEQVAISSPEQTTESKLPIGSGDLIEVTIFGSDFRQEVRVSSTGEISLPLIGALQVAGLTPEEARNFIHDRFVSGNFYKDPQVSVFVKEYGSGGVYILGEVQKPGFYPLTNVRRVLEAVSVAGGTTPRAGKTITVVNRSRPQRALTMTLGDEGATPEHSNFELTPGDTVTISKAGIVYVVGDVRMPTGVVMEHGHLTVLQAIAMAQGTNPTAALNNAKLIRRDPSGPREISLALKKILSAKAPDISLQSDDIVFVPSSASKNLGKKTLDAALQAAVGIAIWGRY